MRSDTSALEAMEQRSARLRLNLWHPPGLWMIAPLALASERLSFTNRIDPSLSVPVEITVLRIGSFLMGFVPGEFLWNFR